MVLAVRSVQHRNIMSLEGGLAVLFALGGEALVNVARQGTIASIFLLFSELAFPSFFRRRRIQPAAAKFQHIRHEILHSTITLMGGAIIGKTIKASINEGYVAFLPMEEGGSPGSYARVMFEVVLYFLVFDAYFYFGHRLFHTKYLYPIHKSHHVSTAPNAIAGFSFNPLEGNFFGLFLPMYSAAMTMLMGGVLKASVIICGLLQVLQSLAIHSGYELAPAWFFEYRVCSFFLTPTFHDRHHEHPNCNYSGFFTWLDDLFGTADSNWRTKYASWRREGRKDRLE